MIPQLPDRIKDAVAHAEKRMSIKQIAKDCDVSVQSVYGWRNGVTINLKGETLVELAEVSGINARWLINGKGKKYGPSEDEKLLLKAFSLFGDELRDGWLLMARATIERDEAKRKQAS